MLPHAKVVVWFISTLSSFEPNEAHRAADDEDVGVLQAKGVVDTAVFSTEVTTMPTKGGCEFKSKLSVHYMAK